ncbi:MAG: S24 family peptidase [Rhodospirillaceae bacterium]|jgi:phage repressor protein C with HTH and peptisase S24 domain|nr:S24 family peptidase [Rhodospirillaceae bacterium]
MTLGARVRQCRLALSWSQTDLASRIGVKQQSIDQLESGKVRWPRYIVELSETLNVPLDWLRHGKGRVHLSRPTTSRDDMSPAWAFEPEINMVAGDDGGKAYFELNGQSFALVPVYDARASAGPGALNADTPQPLYHNVFRQDQLKTLTASQADQLAVIRIADDSMWDTLQDGDFILVDRAITRCNRDGLYVLRYSDGDELVVKRLIRQPSSELLTVKSDNPNYPCQTSVQDDGLFIEGRVVWLSRSIG